MEYERKKIILDHLYYGLNKQRKELRLCSTFIVNGEKKFTKWIPYFEVQEKDYLIKNVNQREMLSNELILDLDEGNYNDYLNLIKKLDKDGFKFHAFATKKGRCRHIHIFDDKLMSYNIYKRSIIREKIIKIYGCDLSLKTEGHMIPIEFVEHWKTGDIKELIFTNRGDWFDTK